MKPIEKTIVLTVVEEMMQSIHNHDKPEQARILHDHPWTKRWLGSRSNLVDLEEVSTGEDFKVELERPVSHLRRDLGLKPLLHIKVSSTNGERLFRFEPVVGKKPEVFVLI